MNHVTPSIGPAKVLVSGGSRKRQLEQHHINSASKATRRKYISSKFVICDICQKLDFAEILSNHSPEMDIRDGYEVYDLSYVSSKSECRLCDFLLRMKQGASSSKKLHGYQLRAYSARKRLLGVDNLQDFGKVNYYVVCAVVSSKGKKFMKDLKRVFTIESNENSKQEGLMRFKDTSNKIDWDHIKTWISFCQQHHTNLCRPAGTVPGLTVIDCETNIVPLPTDDTPYLTLSYVVSLGSPKFGPLAQI